MGSEMCIRDSFESEDGYIDQDTEEEYKNDDELLEAVRTSVASGFYDDFEYEWEKFLKEFDEWYKALKEDGE